MPLKQVLLIRNPTGSVFGADGSFLTIFAPNDSVSGSDARIHTYFPVPGILKNLYITSTSAPSVGNAGGATINKNGSPTSLVASVVAGQTVGQDISNSISIAAGDHISYTENATGTGLGGQISPTIEFIPTTNKVSIYGSNDTNAVLDNGANNYIPVFGYSSLWGLTAATNWSISAIAGTLIGYIFAVNVTPGTGNSWFGHYYKSTDGGLNFVKQDGAGGTVNTLGTITGNGPTQVQTSFSLSVNPGDIFYFEATPDSTPSNTRAGVTHAFLATNPNEYNVGGISAAYNITATRYNQLNNYTGVGNTGTEGNVESYGGYTTVKLDRLYAALSVAPGAAASGKSVTIRSRKNTGNVGPSVTISETATTGNDTSTAAVEILKTDKVAISMVPANSPTVGIPVWAMRARVNPGGGSGKGRNARGAVKVLGSSEYIDWDYINFFGV